MNRIWLFVITVLLAGCDQHVWNDPYPAHDSGANILYSSFEERPKHLDPAQSYSSNETEIISQIYEPPLQYHYLKRPYTLIPQTLSAMPSVTYLNAAGRILPHDAAPDSIAQSVYELHIRPGIHYQPHPAFALDDHGQLRYAHLSANDWRHIHHWQDFRQLGTRELVAADYVYEIKRLASPQVNSPILGLMSEHIAGLQEYADRLSVLAQGLPENAYLDLNRYPLAGAEVVDRYTYRIRLKGKYPQFLYWLAMPFFSPVPSEVDRFYHQPGMTERNFTLDWHPVGTGPYLLSENDPNRQMILTRNPNYHGDNYPVSGEPGDAAAGLLRDAGKPLPFIDQEVFSLEKETIPYWNKFLQGYYDLSGIGSNSFDQAIRVDAQGQPQLTDEMRRKGMGLATAVTASNSYVGFNMLDSVVGGVSERARKLRQAIAIAVDYEEFISIFANGRGIPAQGPIPPGIYGYDDSGADFNPVVYHLVNGKVERRPIGDAKRLLAEAGYPDGRDAKTGAPLVMYLDTPAAGPDAKAGFDWMIKQFAKLNIQLVVRSTDYNRFQDKIRHGSAQMFVWGWNADYPDPENFLFLLYGPNMKVGKNGENVANYQNPQFDALFDKMKYLDNGPERLAIIRQMVDIVRTDSPWLFGYFPKAFGLRQAWMSPTKPNVIANNTLKYRKIDPLLRQQLRKKWNRPVLWPLLALGGLIFALLLPAIWAWRQRERSVAK
ncbi:MAG: ABC transporter substrate-binding protein [Sulfuriferula sp.]|nr:ABC transporter substrate-binding protein [Sulfuriferula sp.]